MTVTSSCNPGFPVIKLALAGYNAGENTVEKYGNQIPPYDETQEYVRKVLKLYSQQSPTLSSVN